MSQPLHRSYKSDRLDNAVAESFFKSLKSELVYQQDFQTQATAKQAAFEYTEVCGAARRYNRQRRHSALGYFPPFDYYNE